MIIYGALLNIYWAYLTTQKTTILSAFLARFIHGYIKQIIWDSNNFFLAEKHSNENGVINIKYIHIFRYFFSSVVILLS